MKEKEIQISSFDFLFRNEKTHYQNDTHYKKTFEKFIAESSEIERYLQYKKFEDKFLIKDVSQSVENGVKCASISVKSITSNFNTVFYSRKFYRNSEIANLKINDEILVCGKIYIWGIELDVCKKDTFGSEIWEKMYFSRDLEDLKFCRIVKIKFSAIVLSIRDF
jgi:hypothetical protein